MLSAVRQGGARQFVVGLIVFAIIFVFVLEFRSAATMKTGAIKRECAASVDGECLTTKDFQAEFGLVVPRGMSAKQIKAYGLRKQVLDGLVERELLIQAAKKLGLGTDEEGAKRELRLGRAHVSLPAETALRVGFSLDLVSADETGIQRDLVRELPIVGAKTGEVDDDLYGRVVRSMTNRSPKEFLKMQVRELLAARMRDLVRSRVRVSDDEAFEAFAREKSKAVVRYVRLDPEWFARWAVDTSDAAVDGYISANQAEVDAAFKTEAAKWTPNCPLASEISQTFREGMTEAQKSLLKDKMDRAAAALDGGASFATVARQFSDGPTAATGGSVGCLTQEGYGDGWDTLVKAATGLPANGASAVVETKSGYHIVKPEGTLPADVVEKVGKRAVALTLLARKSASASAQDLGKRLLEASKAGRRLDDTLSEALGPILASAKPKSEGAATEEADEPARSDQRFPRAVISAPFGIDGEPILGIVGGTPVGKIAFGLEKPDDVYPELVAVGTSHVVVQLKEKTMATREEFATQKSDTVRRLEIAKKADALSRYVARLRREKQEKIALNERILDEPKAADRDD